MPTAKLIIADSEKNADLYYATRFLAPDPFILIQIDGRKTLVMSDLEIDRARAQSSAQEILSHTQLAKQARERLKAEPALVDVVDEVLRRSKITSIDVPMDFSVWYADGLRKRGYDITPKPEPFYPERVIKSEQEIAHLTQSLRATESALASAIELIHNSEIRDDGTLWIGRQPAGWRHSRSEGHQGRAECRTRRGSGLASEEGTGSVGSQPLTAELVRKVLHLRMMEQECVGQHTIVAPGFQAVDPHNEGSGMLRAHEPIVMDVFPQHARTRYFADITRTVVKGHASDKIRTMFDAVKHGQEIAYGLIKDGADGGAIHQQIMAYFESLGFRTGERDGRMQGFFHGTGHGVGLEIHEPPRISSKPDTLRAGMVVTVEPGLYYADAGGIRIEDMVVVTKNGCQILTEAPKILEI